MELISKTDALQKNYQVIESIKKLEENWNDNHANPFSPNLIRKVAGIISVLKVQPQIFPTARNSIQLEYEKENGDYLEFEIYEEFITCYQEIGQEVIDSKIDKNEIPELVCAFHA